MTYVLFLFVVFGGASTVNNQGGFTSANHCYAARDVIITQARIAGFRGEIYGVCVAQ